MPLPVRFSDFNSIQREIQLNEILELNGGSAKYGLSLSPGEARTVIAARCQVLRNYGRVELDFSVTRDLIKEFQSSPYIEQEDYVEALNTLHEIFYHLKNVTGERISDTDLICLVRECFENTCSGSLELLAGIGLEEIVKKCSSRRESSEDLY